MAVKTSFSITVLRKRLLSLTVAIAFIFCIIATRFFFVQVVSSDKLKMKAEDQWNREIPIVASRGIITDCNGEVIVGNKTTYSLFVRPNSVKDKEGLASALAKEFDLETEAIFQKISTSKVSEITVAKRCDKEKIENIVKQNFAGVYYAKDNTRVYSYDQTLCQVLGFTSSDGIGLTGLEKFYNNVLGGSNGEILYSTDIVGNQTDDCKIVYSSPSDGNEVRLTIDLDIQLACENVIQSVYTTSQAKSASCIVLDVNNFDILAMANCPSYDLNDIPRDDMDLLNSRSRNTLVCDIYEPGSTFKIITAAANLEEYYKGNSRAYSPTYVFNSSRTRSVDGTTIKCWSNHANGKHCNQTLAEALNNSCNPCFTDMALSLGKETFYEYLKAFGFGSKTGIDYGGEAYGLLLNKSIVRDCDLARIGFGQTIAVTGLQLACAAASVVNGGNYYEPHLIKSVIDQNGKVIDNKKDVLKSKVISEKTSSMMCKMLEGVVKEGSGKKAYIEGFMVGGKTGTAQKYENGRIAAGKYVSSFVGFFPANNPTYLALVVVDEPQGTYYGSTVAAPVAKDIFEDIIRIRNLKAQG